MFSKQGVSMGIKAYRAIEAGEEITVSCPFIFSPRSYPPVFGNVDVIIRSPPRRPIR
jgi:hypothetical protein